MSLTFTLSDLRQCPQFFDIVADRIWRAWWQADGTHLNTISLRVHENLKHTPIPFALVAHDGEAFLGTASVIASDLAERPQLTPWIAAVWVEEGARRKGVGAALVDRTTRDCFKLGIERAYLCARSPMTCFYERLGWTVVERDVGQHLLTVLIREANAAEISRSPP